jgi:hypothetical protein
MRIGGGSVVVSCHQKSDIPAIIPAAQNSHRDAFNSLRPTMARPNPTRARAPELLRVYRGPIMRRHTTDSPWFANYVAKILAAELGMVLESRRFDHAPRKGERSNSQTNTPSRTQRSSPGERWKGWSCPRAERIKERACLSPRRFPKPSRRAGIWTSPPRFLTGAAPMEKGTPVFRH